jgi:hypothetical protein
LTFYTQQWEEYHAHVLRTFIGSFGVTEGISMQFLANIGILLTLSGLLAVAVTNGGIAVWTLQEMLPYTLPEYIGGITLPMFFAVMALYK